MAITGKKYVPISPGRRQAGLPRVVWKEEASSQTGTQGAPVYIDAGYAKAGTTSNKLYGFLESAQSNSAANGDDKSRVLVAEEGKEFVGTLGNVTSFTQAMVGSYAQLTVGSSTYYLQTVASSVSSNANCRIERPAGNFAVGDSTPEVVFTVIESFIQTV